MNPTEHQHLNKIQIQKPTHMHPHPHTRNCSSKIPAHQKNNEDSKCTCSKKCTPAQKFLQQIDPREIAEQVCDFCEKALTCSASSQKAISLQGGKDP